MSEQTTSTTDNTYNLVSVLYHALQGGATCLQYMQDARDKGDEELVQFFHDVQDCQRHLAGRAREMLKRRLNRGDGEEWDQERTMGMHQHTAGRSQPAGQEYTAARTQGTIGPQRHVKVSDPEHGETTDEGEGIGLRRFT
jgi:hypothetical protein